MARETVTGLTRYSSVIARVDGRRVPGARRRTSARSSLASFSVLVSFFMRTKNSAIDGETIAVGVRS
jgi:hypothetical protein